MQKLRKFCKTNKNSQICTELKKVKSARDNAFNAVEEQCAKAPSDNKPKILLNLLIYIIIIF